MSIEQQNLTSRHALKFILLLGIVSLFADMTYEGARSITGPFLASLGASAAIVGIVAGFGELVGYSLRFVSGYLADKTQRYWTITIVGYLINLLVVPLLALTYQWPLAAVLIVLERFGKAVRAPAKDAMLSHAGDTFGMGRAFGLHEAMDQIGAMSGPLLLGLILYIHSGAYRLCFAMLLIPALLAIVMLFVAKHQYPHPQKLSVKRYAITTEKYSRQYWFYLVATLCIAAGYADYPLIAYHFEKVRLMSSMAIPIMYAFAMAIDAATAPLWGNWYDRHGIIVLLLITLVTAAFAPLVFLGASYWVWLGVALWAVGMGAHQSLMRAVVGNMVSADKRASAYGLFNLAYGVAWFIGSTCIGVLYDYAIIDAVIFCLLLQLIALPLLWITKTAAN